MLANCRAMLSSVVNANSAAYQRAAAAVLRPAARRQGLSAGRAQHAESPSGPRTHAGAAIGSGRDARVTAFSDHQKSPVEDPVSRSNGDPGASSSNGAGDPPAAPAAVEAQVPFCRNECHLRSGDPRGTACRPNGTSLCRFITLKPRKLEVLAFTGCGAKSRGGHLAAVSRHAAGCQSAGLHERQNFGAQSRAKRRRQPGSDPRTNIGCDLRLSAACKSLIVFTPTPTCRRWMTIC